MADVVPKFLGNYRIDSTLGHGAMSVVYRATDRINRRAVALKVLRPELLAGSERQGALARFQREAEIGLRLRHPNIVKVYDHGEVQGVPYLAMELVQGRSLKEVIDSGPRLTVEPIVHLAVQLLDGLAAAHEQGIVHRDVKPANIVIQANLSLKLTDFGVAHIASAPTPQTNEMVGTPAYMAPEQLQGQDVDRRADLFAVGVILYYLLTGRRPFRGTVANVMHQIMFVHPPAPSRVDPLLPPGLDPIILRAVAKERSRRFTNAHDFITALLAVRHDIQTGVPIDDPLITTETPVTETPVTDAATPVLDAIFGAEALHAECALLAGVLKATLAALPVEQLSGQRLDELSRSLDDWLQYSEHLDTEDPAHGDAVRRSMLDICLESGLRPALELILEGVPAPGRPAANRCGDWMAAVRLFVLLRDTLRRLGGSVQAEPLAESIRNELSNVFIHYSTELSKRLLSDESPNLMQISADFARLDVLQTALEKLGAEAELRIVRRTMPVFASQVMRKANATIRQFTETGTLTARFSVSFLLMEIEELIAIASRLLEDDAGAPARSTHFNTLGTEVVAEFIANAQTLTRLTIDALHNEVAGSSAGSAAAEDEEESAGFADRLKQLGSLYIFAVRLPGASCRNELRALTSEVHGLIGGLVRTVLKTPEPAATNHAQLTALFDLADQLGWNELSQPILSALRNHVVGHAASHVGLPEPVPDA